MAVAVRRGARLKEQYACAGRKRGKLNFPKFADTNTAEG